jgi:phosphosulfolactate phosphohydrolase-like enzyme
VVLAAVVGVVNLTKLARRLRATAENPRVAGLMGVKPDFIISATFVIGATLAAIAARDTDAPLVIVCAGSAGALNLEDFYAAGCIVDRLLPQLDPMRDLSDTALSAHAAFRASDAMTALSLARVGRIIRGAGGEREIRHAAEIDASKLVAVVEENRVVRSN